MTWQEEMEPEIPAADISGIEMLEMKPTMSKARRLQLWTEWLELPDLDTVQWVRIDTPHTEEEQVLLDVERSFVFYPDGDTTELRKQLLDLMVQVLRKHPQLSYYQGYHDAAQIVLLVCGPDKSPFVLEKLSLRYLRDFMLPTISPTLEQLNLIPALIGQYDSELSDRLVSRYGPTPFYALSPILTMFAHHIKNFESICRLYDYIFESKSMATPIYLYVSLVLLEKERLDDDSANDRDILYSLLTNLADDFNDKQLDQVIDQADAIAFKTPLHNVKEWESISSYSVLKQVPANDNMTLEDVKECIEKQSLEPPVEIRPISTEKESIAVEEENVVSSSSWVSIGLVVVAVTAYYLYTLE